MVKRLLLSGLSAACIAAGVWAPLAAAQTTDKYGQATTTTTSKPASAAKAPSSKLATTTTTRATTTTTTAATTTTLASTSAPAGEYIVVDDNAGVVLAASSAARTPRRPASLSKVITALVVLQKLPLDSAVTVSAKAAAMPDSQAGLIAGKSYRARDLFDVMIVGSANDAAVALAEAASGSLDGFAKDAAALANTLGLRDKPTLVDPSGLDDNDSFRGGNWISAADLAIVARVALVQPEVMAAAEKRSVSFTSIDGSHAVTKTSTNKLFKLMGVRGLKTGYTSAARHTQILVTTRGARTLITVALGEPTSAQLEGRLVLMTEAGFGLTANAGMAKLPAPATLSRTSATPSTTTTTSAATSSGPTSTTGASSSSRSTSQSTSSDTANPASDRSSAPSPSTPPDVSSTRASRSPAPPLPVVAPVVPRATVATTTTTPTTAPTTTAPSTAAATTTTTTTTTTIGTAAVLEAEQDDAPALTRVTREPPVDSPLGVIALGAAGVAGAAGAIGAAAWRRVGANRRFDHKHFR